MERQKILVILLTSVAIKTVSLSDLPLNQYPNADKKVILLFFIVMEMFWGHNRY
jgi:hypothetical protein